MAIVIYGDGNRKIRIPSNLSIIGTMNTSDQNVFTLDTAFQRRWNMRLIENSFKNVRSSLANAEILDTGVSWQHFCETINKLILDNKNKLASAEDKRLGVYFVHENDLRCDKSDNHKQNRKFPEKVIKYLWDDAFKFNTQDLFESSFSSLEALIHHFTFSRGRERLDIFKQNVRDILLKR